MYVLTLTEGFTDGTAAYTILYLNHCIGNIGHIRLCTFPVSLSIRQKDITYNK